MVFILGAGSPRHNHHERTSRGEQRRTRRVAWLRAAHAIGNMFPPLGGRSQNIMLNRHPLIGVFGTVLLGVCLAVAGPGIAARAQPPSLVQPWGLPPLPPGVGPVEKFADVSNTPQGQFLE